MSLVAVPTSASNRKWIAWPVALLVSGVVAAASWFVYARAHAPADVSADAQYYHAATMDLDVKIAKDGELQAVNNIDIQNQVEGNTTITHLVNEGEFVKKGQVLITLDSLTIRQMLDDASLALQTAEDDLTNANEIKKIQESQNDAALQAAEVAVQLAKMDLQQYNAADGTYQQLLTNANTDLQMADLTLKNKQEDLDRTKKLYAKGFVTGADMKTAELNVTSATNDLNKAKTALTVLEKYTHQMDLATKNNTLAQAEATLERTKSQNAASLAQKTADVNAKEHVYAIDKRKVDHLKEQLADCTITAPADGLVVYSTSTDRSAQNALQEGLQIHERQQLLRLPDTSQMKAVVRILESNVPKLQIGQRARVRIVGVPNPIGATLTNISVLPDNSQRWWNPDLKEYPVELALDYTPPGLKPGVNASVEILVDHVPNCLAVPLSTVYAAGADNYVFVRTGDEPRPVKVKLGAVNETNVQVLDGLAPGADVLVLQSGQGHDLLERNGIHVQEAPGDQGGAFAPKPAKSKLKLAPTSRPTTQPDARLAPTMPQARVN